MTDLTADLDDVEVLPEGEPVEDAPKATKAAKEKAPKIEYGAAKLAEHVSAETGTTVDAKAVRMVLRKLTSEGKLEHEAGGRYDFTGPEDPRVVVVVDAFRAKIAKAAEPKAPRKAKGSKAKADSVPAGETVEDEDAPVEDLDDLDA